MNELQHLCKTFSSKAPHDRVSRTRPVSCWTEKDRLNGEVVDAFVVILATKGCTWAQGSGCTMCGYGNDSVGTTVSAEDFEQQLHIALQSYHGEPLVKIFNSGSFLDDCEIPPSTRSTILSAFSQARKISVESRPEYITEHTLSTIQDSLHNQIFEVGIGLETANDFVRDHAINKGFTYTQYKTAADLLRRHHVSVKTYVLVKPPFLTEHEAYEDSLHTIKTIAPLTDIISLNPVNVQRHTLVEYLWHRDEYRPPWLWTLVQLIQEGHRLYPGHLKCDVTGGGNPRGPHNCKTCDHQVLSALSDFSLHQDTSVFTDLSCSCQEQWRDQYAFENLTFGSIVDWSRWKP